MRFLTRDLNEISLVLKTNSIIQFHPASRETDFSWLKETRDTMRTFKYTLCGNALLRKLYFVK